MRYCITISSLWKYSTLRRPIMTNYWVGGLALFTTKLDRCNSPVPFAFLARIIVRPRFKHLYFYDIISVKFEVCLWLGFLFSTWKGWFSIRCQCRPQGQIAYTGLKIWFGTFSTFSWMVLEPMELRNWELKKN